MPSGTPGVVGAVLRTLLVLAMAWPTHAGARERLDVVRLSNGDRLTGEILTMQFGRLKLNTSYMGTVSIEWADVVAVDSPQPFLVERIGGRQARGTLVTGPDGQMAVVGSDGESFALADVVRVGQVGDTFWDNLEGSVAVGATYAKSNGVNVSSARFDVGSRGPRAAWTLEGSWDRTSSRGNPATDRVRLAYGHEFVRPRARFWSGLGSFERNEELGIDGRLQVGGAHGWRFHEAPDSSAAFYVGAVVNREWTTGTSDNQENIEGVAGLQWRIYRFADPEVSLTSTFAAYPSFTDAGRLRSRADVALRREFADDFTLQLTLYHDYDNRPPGARETTSDYGFATSLGYSF